MKNPYSDEWEKINKIAKDVNTLQEKIKELEIDISSLNAQLSNLSYQTDEDGTDKNEGKRNTLYAQIDSLNDLTNELSDKKQELSDSAHCMAISYRKKALEYEQNAFKSSNVGDGFQRLSEFRFGATIALAGGDLAQQRTQHYRDYVAILSDLAIAAESAASGITSSANTQSISDRGTFNDSCDIFNESLSVGSDNSNMISESVWRGEVGNSVKTSKNNMVNYTLLQLGVSGIPYKNGVPDFDLVSHAKVGARMAGVGMIAAADARFAKKLGLIGEEAANYRKENGLEWRYDGSGQNVNLIPQSIGDEYNEGKTNESEPNPMETELAYMCALRAYAAAERLIVDMPHIGKGERKTNSEGWLRDSEYYWNEMLERYPEAFSSENRDLIQSNRHKKTSPINDETFRKFFPQYDVVELWEDTLVHHHIGGGGQAYAIPKKLHRGFGGIHNIEKYLGIWGCDSGIAALLERF